MANDMEMVRSALDYIEDHLSEKLDLEIIAESVHYSKYHLHRIFARTAGLTIHDYVQRRRLTEAARLLAFSHRPILEIALGAGYESQQAFTAVFKAMYKKSPGQYREQKEYYPLQARYVLKEHPSIRDGGIDWKKDIRLAKAEDIPKWMELLPMVADGFPYLEEGQHLEQLKEYIRGRRALILTDGGSAVGAMGFTPDTDSIDFLGFHPQYRSPKTIQAFLKKAFSLLEDSAKLSVTTFRKGDKADPGCRRMLKNAGFAEAGLLMEYGYPTQRFVLRRNHLEADIYE